MVYQHRIYHCQPTRIDTCKESSHTSSIKFGCLGRNRTYDQVINSHLLLPLSYFGIILNKITNFTLRLCAFCPNSEFLGFSASAIKARTLIKLTLAPIFKKRAFTTFNSPAHNQSYLFKSGTLDRIRTCDQWLRRPLLYPTELTAL